MRPRNDDPMPTGWRTTGRTRVGDRYAGGQVTVWLEAQGRNMPPRVGVNVAEMGGLAVYVSIEDARALRDALDDLLDQADQT